MSRPQVQEPSEVHPRVIMAAVGVLLVALSVPWWIQLAAGVLLIAGAVWAP